MNSQPPRTAESPAPIPVKPTGVRDAVVGFGAVAAIIAVVAGLGLFGAVSAGGPDWLFAAIPLAVLLAVWALGLVFVRVWRHLVALERLRGAVVTLAGHEEATPSSELEQTDAPEVARLSIAIGNLWDRMAGRRQASGERLADVLASVAAPILVVTDQGQVSLVNAAAYGLLGREQVRVGTSVFAALHRTPVIDAMERSAADGCPVIASLTATDGRSFESRVFGFGRPGRRGDLIGRYPGHRRGRAGS